MLGFILMMMAGWLPLAQPYDLIKEGEEVTCPPGDRTAQVWTVTADVDSLDGFGQTAMQAALDLHRKYGTDHTTVLLTASADLPTGPFYAQASFAADSLGAMGLQCRGADPSQRYVWRVWAATRPLTARELSIAESWHRLAPRFPSRDPLSSSMVDDEALRSAVAGSLGIPPEEVEYPHLALEPYRPE
jgi:hypothetical protein